MGCGDSKEKVKEKKSNATDALEASHSTNDPQYENEKAAEGQDAPPSDAKDNNSDTSPYVGKEGTAAAAAAGRPHGVLDAADTPLNREALFPEDQNNQFGIRVGTDKYDSLKDREASLELHSLHDTLDDASEASFASAEFKTAVSAALTTASQGTNNLYSNNPPPPKGRAAASVFEDKDSWTEAQSAAFLTPLNNDDGASMVSAQPHGYDYYNNKNTSKRTSKAPSEVAGANPNKFGRRGSLTVTQVRNNSVTASMHGEIPPSPYTRVSSRGRNFPEADRERVTSRMGPTARRPSTAAAVCRR
ncbi:hypothetical protein ADEAN_000756700 [Angomonas deanei]|uniref:Uncharacterized protein n=1 Tax=Angomonas deanei TaxID=59799 RepID=A0A7G2CN89_9TRYP|nr:hypothetical protein ADEAN_000756700 [Angomonas deanei]